MKQGDIMDLSETVLGIELGSTRIKAVLIDRNHMPVASGGYEWENRLVNGIWTYAMEDVHAGLRGCFAALKDDVRQKFGTELTTVGAIGVSAMMHGYLPFDRDGRQLAEFRTWRNTITGEAAERLTALFGFNIPQRWSIAHFYQAILNGEAHVGDVAYLTTLAGYIHWRLTGEKVMGVGEASGMFPIDSARRDYDETMIGKFGDLTGVDLRAILPKVLSAGESAGTLTEEGARFLDPAGTLRPGIPVAPCEGDAGTGMAATNAVRVRTGNVSAGTSDFAMIVTDKALGVHREIDMVTTPDGAPVAMVHCNNCTSDINAWVSLFSEFCGMMGIEADRGELFTRLFRKALEGEPDCGGLISYNYFSGEGVTDLDEGRPVFLRTPDARLTLANFMRAHLLSALSTLKIGLDILTQTEQVPIDRLYGHGGFFKTPEVGQRMLSAAVGAPVSVMETAGEGGPYGMALLGAYMLWREPGETLPDYLDNKVFAGTVSTTITADERDKGGFAAFLERYKKALPVERLATERI
ncbi:MAG: FGGY-family carbohydrate kinase [Oscillospiraceae bacterium]|nr:FGGY-family carbohydrate kinase [Oscillospiraceae bacterium]